jgi:type I restriction enzyme S subunit
MMRDDWAEVNIGTVCKLNPKVTNKNNISDNLEVQFLPMKLVEAIVNKMHHSEIRKFGDVQRKSYTYFADNDILFAKVTPCMENGKIVIANNLKNGIGYGSSEFHILRCSNAIINVYLFYFLIQSKFRSDAQHAMTGAVGLRRVPKKYLENYSAPLAPLPEQRAIVAKIEELFSSLDNGISDLNKASAQLKIYRQAVLKKAFRGELSKEWRAKQTNLPTASELLQQIQTERQNHHQQQLTKWQEAVQLWEDGGKEGKKPAKPRALKKREPFGNAELEHLGNIPAGWCWAKIGSIFNVFIGSTPKRKEKKYWTNGTVNWVSSGEVSFNSIVTTKEKITELGLQKTSTTIHPKGTVMLAMIGEGKTRGQAAILKICACHNQNTAAIRVSEIGFPAEFLFHYLFLKYQQNRKVGSGNNQKALNQGRINNFEYPLCSVEEQLQIVQEIESRLSVCDNIEQSISASLAKAEALRQSILKKAFAGELLSSTALEACRHEADWQPASELLKQIKAEQKS